jgi:hypothetical protein
MVCLIPLSQLQSVLADGCMLVGDPSVDGIDNQSPYRTIAFRSSARTTKGCFDLVISEGW